MASLQVDESSKPSPYKKHGDFMEECVDAATKYHQKFFTIIDQEKEDEDFLPELITTGKDPQNHNIEIELGKDEELARSKRNSASGMVPIHPVPFIKVDLNNNYRNWEAKFAELKESAVPDQVDWLKTVEPVHSDPGSMPPDPLSNKPSVTFASSRAGGLADTQYFRIFGTDISDIPTSYDIPKLAAHELCVVGTFVHGMVITGFSYRVRLNGTNQYLFDGNPLTLQTIGQGYGKRLMFESDDLLYNKNYFWSDNNPPNGYAFSIYLPIVGEFEVKNKDGTFIGNLTVKNVADDQIIQTVQCFHDWIQIEVHVKILGNLACSPYKDTRTSDKILQGVAIATKKGSKVRVNRIEKVSIAGLNNCFVMERAK